MDSSNNRSAFSLIEVNLAILLIAVGLLALFSLFPLGLKESERGLADTQESMFADTVLSALEGNAVNMTNWWYWLPENHEDFKAKIEEGVDYRSETLTTVEYPQGSRYRIRYVLNISNEGTGRKSAMLKVLHGTTGDFALAQVYYTEFVYTGM